MRWKQKTKARKLSAKSENGRWQKTRMDKYRKKCIEKATLETLDKKNKIRNRLGLQIWN